MSGQKGEWRIFSLSNDLQVSWNPRKGEKLFKFDFYRGRCLYWGLFECLNRRFPIRFTSENVLPQMIRLKETIALIKAVFFPSISCFKSVFSDQVWRSHKLLLHHRCNWDQPLQQQGTAKRKMFTAMIVEINILLPTTQCNDCEPTFKKKPCWRKKWRSSLPLTSDCSWLARWSEIRRPMLFSQQNQLLQISWSTMTHKFNGFEKQHGTNFLFKSTQSPQQAGELHAMVRKTYHYAIQ